MKSFFITNVEENSYNTNHQVFISNSDGGCAFLEQVHDTSFASVMHKMNKIVHGMPHLIFFSLSFVNTLKLDSSNTTTTTPCNAGEANSNIVALCNADKPQLNSCESLWCDRRSVAEKIETINISNGIEYIISQLNFFLYISIIRITSVETKWFWLEREVSRRGFQVKYGTLWIVFQIT